MTVVAETNEPGGDATARSARPRHLIVTVYGLYARSDGGWLSGAFIKRGWSVNAGRKTTMLIAAVLIVPTILAPTAPNMWTAVVIVGIAAASHQWWSANIFTLSSDMFPRYAIGSVVGIGGFAGAMGGTAFQYVTGHVLQANGNNYTPIFVVCGLAFVADHRWIMDGGTRRDRRAVRRNLGGGPAWRIAPVDQSCGRDERP